jgi:hypothetical protein
MGHRHAAWSQFACDGFGQNALGRFGRCEAGKMGLAAQR